MNKKTNWKVIWKEEAEEDWEKIRQTNPSAAKEIKREIDRHLATNPKENGVKMREIEWKNCYRYKIGKYRIIYKLKEKQLIILVVLVGERKPGESDDVYEKKLPRITSQDWITAGRERPQAPKIQKKSSRQPRKAKVGA